MCVNEDLAHVHDRVNARSPRAMRIGDYGY
jgi:hypothetical protein